MDCTFLVDQVTRSYRALERRLTAHRRRYNHSWDEVAWATCAVSWVWCKRVVTAGDRVEYAGVGGARELRYRQSGTAIRRWHGDGRLRLTLKPTSLIV